MKISDIKAREPNAGKRKRIPLHPSLRQGITSKNISTMPGEQVHLPFDDRDPDMIHHFRINARLEEERRRTYWPHMGI